MSTLTALTAKGRVSPIKTLHTGLQSVYVEHSFTASVTASSIIKLAKIPNGALITEFMWAGGPGDGVGTVVIGTSASPSCILAATSMSALGNGSGVLSSTTLPHRVSLSDDAQPQWVWVQAKVKAVGISWSAAGGRLRTQMNYRNDD